MKCQIEWIDTNGKPTPDENEAIGLAHMRDKTYMEGDRVMTPLGPGTVKYVRMAPPDYSEIAAVSVFLDSRAVDAAFGRYSGTIFPASDVRPEET